MAKTELLGVKEMMLKITNIAAGAPAKVAAALQEETKVITEECKRIVPVDTGALKGTIHQEGPVIQGTKITTSILAGDSNTAHYAVKVHEIPDPPIHHAGGTSWKYIERPLFAAKSSLADRIAKRVKL